LKPPRSPHATPPRPLVEPLEDRRLLASLPAGFAQSLVTGGLTGPTAMVVAPDGRVFVAEQRGQLRVIKNGKLLPTPFLTVSSQLRGERGLVGVELDPNFSTNGYVYVYYTPSSSNGNRVSRFTAGGDVAIAGSEKVLFQLDSGGITASIHQGGAMHFGPDGKLYVAVGDHGEHARSQQLSNQNGKILRLNKDGTIPTDNPFYNVATGRNRAIWALGLRNPYTFAIQPGTGRMLINDVGENAWEEVNQGKAGANYGWPDTEGATSDARFKSPLYSYSHASGKAIVGGTFYNPRAGAGSPFPSSYVGDYFFMDFDQAYIKRLDNGTSSTARTFASNLAGKVVDLDVAPDGSLYYLTRGRDTVAAGVYRIGYTAAGQTRTLASTADAYVTDGLSANKNYGSTGELLVRSSGGFNRHAYYKFDLASVGNIASAKLRLFGRLISTTAADSVTTGVFSASGAAWGESTLTWNNRPASGTTALATARVTAGASRWYEWDLTSYLRQQKAAGRTSVTLVIKNLTPSKTQAGFRSKESSSNRPQLVVTG
jgi:glucose/arabinose dehydrogenase